MKYVTGLLVTAVTLLGSLQAYAAETVIFQCTLDDGKSVMVERNTQNDVFTLTHGTDLHAPTLTIRKPGNNLGTAIQMSRTEGLLNRELYVTEGTQVYTVGYIDQQGIKKGYLQIMNAGFEESYQECQRASLHSTFDDYELFSNLTTVD